MVFQHGVALTIYNTILALVEHFTAGDGRFTLMRC